MRQIRRRFILVAMSSTFIVLFAIMSVIFFVNYRNLEERADAAIDVIRNKDTKEEKGLEWPRPSFRKDMPFTPRYFFIKLDKKGQADEFQRGEAMSELTEKTAKKYAGAVRDKGKKAGFYHSFRYRTEEEGETFSVWFVDCTRELDTMYHFFVSGISVSCLGLFLIFILVVFFSNLVFRPVWESYKKQRQFITDASHELKTPLTIIDANTEVLEMMQGENEWTESIRNQVKRLSSLTNQMTMLARMEEEQKKPEMEEMDFSLVLKETIQPFYTLAERNGKSFVFSADSGLILKGNRELLKQLVMILVDNSVKYSVNNGEIFISLARKGRKVVFKVSNESTMIQKGNMDILFERFYRTDASRSSETGGSGIGLSVAKAIVEVHNGKIHAESADGKILVITVIL